MKDIAQFSNGGYLHNDYVRSFGNKSDVLPLPLCRGWLLKRPIRNSLHYDAMGSYPLFCCEEWQNLSADLATLDDTLVSVTLVTDPFGNHNQETLQHCFPQLCRPFKEHFVVDLTESPQNFISSHHRRYGKKACKNCTVELCENPGELLHEWVTLYQNLITRHNIQGFLRFSPEIFARQLSVPGILAFRATQGTETLGISLWYRQGNIAYYHLAAYSDAGYQLRASFGLFWEAIHYFRESGLDWLDVGAGPGLNSDGQDGLSHFKQGWSTGSKTAYLCGRIGNPSVYAELAGESETSYFPAYRAGEFG